MKLNFRGFGLLLAALLLSAAPIGAKKPVAQPSPEKTRIDSLREVRKNRMVPVRGSIKAAYDAWMLRSEVGKHLFRTPQHPMLDSLLTPEREREILAAINRRCDSLGKDTLLTADLFWVSKPYFDFLYHEDPHLRIARQVPIKDDVKDFYKSLRQPAFDVLSVNDTLIVNRSLDPQFRTGDMILSINDVPTADYLRYAYADRYADLWQIMAGYHSSHLLPEFRFELLRNGERFEVTTLGQPARKTDFALMLAGSMDKNIRSYPESKCGYIAIPAFFPVNSRLIKIVRRSILDFKAKGFTNVVLDLRRNPGGNGDAFDELLSIFTDKPTLQNTRNVWVKGSPQAREVYEFLTEAQDGQLVALPDDEVVREFATNPKMYVGGMNYYVLMSKDTGSVAATFCNLMQYSGAAKLVGEPLLHNAFRYGDVIDGRPLLPTLFYKSAISITLSDDYTRAVDGVLTPDIPIPYVAADYLGGADVVLDKLLSMLR